MLICIWSLGFNLILAIMQLAGVYFPLTPPFLNSSLLVDEMEPESRFICDSVKIISFEHTSINFVAVICIIAATVLLTMLSVLDSLFGSWEAFRNFYSA